MTTDSFSKDFNEIKELEKVIQNDIKARKAMDNKDQKTLYVLFLVKKA